MFCFESLGGGPFGFTGDLPRFLDIQATLPLDLEAAFVVCCGRWRQWEEQHAVPWQAQSAQASARLKWAQAIVEGCRRPIPSLLCSGRLSFLELRPSLREQLAMFGLYVLEKHHFRHIVPSRPLPSHLGACLATPSRGCDGSLAVEC